MNRFQKLFMKRKSGGHLEQQRPSEQTEKIYERIKMDEIEKKLDAISESLIIMTKSDNNPRTNAIEKKLDCIARNIERMSRMNYDFTTEQRLNRHEEKPSTEDFIELIELSRICKVDE